LQGKYFDFESFFEIDFKKITKAGMQIKKERLCDIKVIACRGIIPARTAPYLHKKGTHLQITDTFPIF